MRRSLPLIATLTAEAGAVLVLYRFIKEPGLAIPIAFGCAAWLLGTTVLYLAACLSKVPAAVNAVGRVTLPVLRRRVDRAIAASILTGALVATGSPALAAADPTPPPVSDAAAAAASEPVATAPAPSDDVSPTEPPVEDTPAPEVPETTTPKAAVRSGRAGDPAAIVAVSTVPEHASTTTSRPRADAPSSGVRRGAAPTAPRQHRGGPSVPAGTLDVVAPVPTVAAPAAEVGSYTVASGDSFWEIAARRVAASTGRDRAALTATDITPYWARLCDANRDRIRSGDVNLIYTGEVVELPSI